MSREALVIGSESRSPALFLGDYTQWSEHFLDFIDRQPQGEEMRDSITKGLAVFYETIQVHGSVPLVNNQQIKSSSKYSATEKERAKADRLACSYILQGITNEIYNDIDSNKTTKSMWDEIKRQIKGTNVGARLKVMNCITTFDNFKAKDDERIEQTYSRYCQLLNDLKKNYIIKQNLELNVRS